MDMPGDALVNYVFPNNVHVFWALMIVVYPFITGLMAGAFVVSALFHVFKVKIFKPIANFALIAAFCFGAFAGTPLLFHLGQPQRAYEIFVTPHLTSAMSIFGYVWSGYMLLLLIEMWLIYREHFVRMANATEGFMGRVWHALTLGVTTYHPGSARIDHKLSAILAGIGIPWAMLLHGYVGFIFGSVKAIAWWATPLQPVIFVLSAMVSGMGVLLLMYTFIQWKTRAGYDYTMVKRYMAYLWGIFLLDFTLEMLELATVVYEKGWHWSVVGPLLAGPLFDSFVIWQVLILSGIPIFLVGYVALSSVQTKKMLYLANLGSALLVAQVLFMRFNVVVGGQLISKSERGFVDFHWEFFGREGILVAMILLSGPFVLYYLISRFVPVLGASIPEPRADNPGSTR